MEGVSLLLKGDLIEGMGIRTDTILQRLPGGVTTLSARPPAPQSLSFSSLSRYAFPRFFPLLVILSMVRVTTQQWLSHMHVTHAHVSNTW